MAANEVRRKKTDPRIATYQMIAISITPISALILLILRVLPAAGAKDLHSATGDDLSEDRRDGGDGRNCAASGGLHPDLRIEFYETMLRSIQERFPQVPCTVFCPESLAIAEVSGLSLRDTIGGCGRRLVSIPAVA